MERERTAMKRQQRARGLTLVEVLITVAIIGMVMGLTMLGGSVADSSRLRRSAVLVSAAIRVAYGHATAISKPVRLVFDLDERFLILEEATGDLALTRNEKTGGAAAATEAERQAIEEAEQILKGPRPPRPTFKPTKAFGFDPDKDRGGKELEKNIRFLQVETGHQDEPVREGRAYLYFWPGGQTEQAAVQLRIAGSDEDKDMMTVLVSPLTGKAELKKGKIMMPRPRDDIEASERSETGL
jgi:general secretion pathway protein H